VNDAGPNTVGTDKAPCDPDRTALGRRTEAIAVRFVTFVIVPPDGYLHPLERDVAETGLEQRAIHHFRTLLDGTGVILYELRGDPGTAAAVLDDHPTVVSYDVAAADDSREELFVHARIELNELTAGVYDVQRDHDLVLDMPMRYGEDGRLEVTAAGDVETFREAVADVPGDVRLELVRTGEYAPEGGRLFAQLTGRQQVTLRAAVEAGYYEEPRAVTYGEVADRLGVSAGTVGEHLRKIEATVMRSILPRS
jgi:predicted DNA binding protein